MNKKDCTVGLRVAEKSNSSEIMYGDKPWPGTIVEGKPEPGYVLVEWDLHDYQKAAGEKPTVEKVYIKDLLPFDEAKKQFNKLEKEFKTYEKEVKKKLTAAAKLIRDSNKLARKAGAESLTEMYDVRSPLFDALDEAGWNSSSMNC